MAGTRILRVALAMLLGVACGGEKAGGPPAVGGQGTPVGPAGGTVVSDDGLASLEIPAGALAETVPIGIRHVPADQVPEDVQADPSYGRYYEMTPDGLSFSVPARLTIEAAGDEVSAIDPAEPIQVEALVSRSADGTISPLGEQEVTVDLEAGTYVLAGDVEHFSGALRVKKGSEIYFTPTAIDTFAPDAWSFTMTVEPITLPDTNPRNRQLLRSWEALEITNPPTLDIVRNGGYRAGIVEGDHEDVSDVFVAPGDVYERTFEYRCDEAGEGKFGARLSVGPRVADTRALYLTGFNILWPALCRELLTPPVATGDHATVATPEEVKQVDPAIWEVPSRAGSGEPFDDGDAYVTVSGGGGVVTQRLSDGEIVHTVSSGGPAYNALAIQSSIFIVGPTGTAITGWNPATQGFGAFLLGENGFNVTDGAEVPDPSGSGIVGVLAVNNSLGQILAHDATLLAQPPLFTSSDFAGASPVGLWSPPGRGPFLIVSDDTGGGSSVLLWADPSQSTLVDAGTFPGAGRRVACVDTGSGHECVMSGYPSGVTHASWPDRSAAPTMGGTVPVSGPVGVDAAMVGGVPMGLATGFVDGTLHLMDLSTSTPTDTTVALDGCTNPGHATFLRIGGVVTHVLVTCNGNDLLRVIDIADLLPGG